MTARSVDRLVPRDAERPWFWWVVLGIAALLFGVEFWLIYRTVAGWPVDGSWLQRLAG